MIDRIGLLLFLLLNLKIYFNFIIFERKVGFEKVIMLSLYLKRMPLVFEGQGVLWTDDLLNCTFQM